MNSQNKISSRVLVVFIILFSVFSETTYSAATAKTSQTITFGAVPSLVANGTASVTATATSGLGVTFKSLTTTICRLTGSTVSAVAAGTCKIAGNQSGSSTYKAAKQVTQNIVIAKLSQTISYGDVSGILVKANATLSFSSSSGLPVSLKSLTATICSISGSKVIGKKSGACKIAGNVAANKIYNAATQVIQQITVSDPIKTSQTITFGIAPSIVVGRKGTVSATATSNLPVTLTSTTATICSISGTTVTGKVAGTCTIAANQAGYISYSAAAQVTQQITVSDPVKTSQTITFGTAPSIVVGGTGAVSVEATSNLPVTLTSTTSTICSISGTTVTGIAIGTCTIAANQAGNSSYSAAAEVTQSIAISSATDSLALQVPGVATGKYSKMTLMAPADITALNEPKSFWPTGSSLLAKLSP